MKETVLAHRTGFTAVVYVFLIFLGCFSFPVINLTTGLSYTWWIGVLVALGGYSEIGFLQGALYGYKAMGKIMLISLSMTLLGFTCRFLLEYGEVSNTYNFTLPNIGLHLLAVICITVLTAVFTDRNA